MENDEIIVIAENEPLKSYSVPAPPPRPHYVRYAVIEAAVPAIRAGIPLRRALADAAVSVRDQFYHSDAATSYSDAAVQADSEGTSTDHHPNKGRRDDARGRHIRRGRRRMFRSPKGLKRHPVSAATGTADDQRSSERDGKEENVDTEEENYRGDDESNSPETAPTKRHAKPSVSRGLKIGSVFFESSILRRFKQLGTSRG